MKKMIIFLLLAILLGGAALGAMPASCQAQVYPAPPVRPVAVATPWVGPNTPWVYYKGDWFQNGILYYFFGNRYGWAPYYAYPQVYVVRPSYWYASRWNDWYRGHPVYWENFHRSYPHWRDHYVGRRYDENFYNRYHHGMGEGWHHGWHGEH
jgi:hypothetical protein